MCIRDSLMDAALPLHTGDSLSHLAARKLLDGLFQLLSLIHI